MINLSFLLCFPQWVSLFFPSFLSLSPSLSLPCYLSLSLYIYIYIYSHYWVFSIFIYGTLIHLSYCLCFPQWVSLFFLLSLSLSLSLCLSVCLSLSLYIYIYIDITLTRRPIFIIFFGFGPHYSQLNRGQRLRKTRDRDCIMSRRKKKMIIVLDLTVISDDRNR